MSPLVSSSCTLYLVSEHGLGYGRPRKTQHRLSYRFGWPTCGMLKAEPSISNTRKVFSPNCRIAMTQSLGPMGSPTPIPLTNHPQACITGMVPNPESDVNGVTLKPLHQTAGFGVIVHKRHSLYSSSTHKQFACLAVSSETCCHACHTITGGRH